VHINVLNYVKLRYSPVLIVIKIGIKNFTSIKSLPHPGNTSTITDRCAGYPDCQQ